MYDKENSEGVAWATLTNNGQFLADFAGGDGLYYEYCTRVIIG